jgi:mono/diheme cytochrome c family protein
MSARYRTLLTAIALSLAACAEDPEPIEGRDDNVQVEDSAVEEHDAESETDAEVAPAVDAAVVGEQDAAVADAATTTEPDSAVDAAIAVDAAAEPVPSQLPCAVEEVLAMHCQKCHSATAKNGVPLMTRDNLLKISPKYPTDSVITRVLVRSAAVEMPMPPIGKGEPLTEADRAVLENWVNQQSPIGSCE